MSTYVANCIVIICSITIEYILIRLYLSKKLLPTKNNELFNKMIAIIFLETLSNVVSVLFGALEPSNFAITLHIVVNVIYYILYELLFVYIPEYILWNTGQKKYLRKSKFIPVIVSVMTLIIIMTNENIFYVCENNCFHFGKNYYLMNIFPLAITTISLLIFLKETHKKMTARDKGIFWGTFILIGGILSNNVIKDICLMDFFLCFYLIILYITAENPVFFLSERMECYNFHAFESLVDELIFEEKTFYVYGVEIRNFHSIKSRRGTKTFYTALSEFTKWIESVFPQSYVFYTDNKCINILSFTKYDEEKYQKFIHDSMNKKLSLEMGDVHLWTRHLEIDSNSPLCRSASYILNGEIYAIDHSQSKTSVIHVNDTVYQEIEHERDILYAIERAIENDNIRVYIQPLYGCASKQIDGGEVLARIEDPKHGILMPGDFIPLAEKSGMIINLSNIIFEKACQYIATHDLNSANIKFISINCSPVQFEDLDLADKLKDIADTYDVDFSIFKFEVTESYMARSDIMKIHINEFKEYGASNAIDDFGKGYSNLSRLTEFNFDIAKLDMSLVWDYFDNKNTIMKDVINIFQSENLNIVAEGVETEKMARELINLECDYLQGYYFSKPVPAEEFLALVTKLNSDPAL